MSEVNNLTVMKVPLGPFDGRVAAHVISQRSACFITTNAVYVPALPDRLTSANGTSSDLHLRQDMRWGPDDPTVWPQEYVETYGHLCCIPRRPRTQQQLAEQGIMWWSPAREDFVSPATGRTLTRGLGKLSQAKVSALSPLVHGLLQKCKEYLQSHPSPAHAPALLKLLMTELEFALDRLSSIPVTYDRMVLGVRAVQRCWLEISGFMQYMTICKPRMDDPDAVAERPNDYVGAFTANPEFAQRLQRGGIPYWLLRPLTAFHEENILKVVQPWDPADYLEMAPAPDYPAIPAGHSLEERMGAIHYGYRTQPWYTNPLKIAVSPPSVMPSVVSAPSHRRSASGALPGSSDLRRRDHARDPCKPFQSR